MATSTATHATIYRLPSCVQCDGTKRLMNKKGISYTEVDLTEHPDKVAEFKARGLSTAPIVETPYLETWSGLRPDYINKLAEAIEQEQSAVADTALQAA